MAAITLQRGLSLCRLAIRRAVLLPRGNSAKTAVHCTLVRICRHSPSSPALDWVGSFLSDAYALLRDAGSPRYRLLSSRCAACFRLVSVSLAPLNMRAI